MKAYVSAVNWPSNVITWTGYITKLRTCGGPLHLGIVLVDCDEAQVAAHSAEALSEPSARGKACVSFDYLSDRRPRFQGLDGDYFANARVALYEIRSAAAEEVHRMCVHVAQARPFNDNLFKLNPLFGGCWPCSLGSAGAAYLPPSHCVALTMRIVAAARVGSQNVMYDDRDVFCELGVPRGGLLRPFSPRVLNGFVPGGAVAAMVRFGCLRSPVHMLPTLVAAEAASAEGRLPLLLVSDASISI